MEELEITGHTERLTLYYSRMLNGDGFYSSEQGIRNRLIADARHRNIAKYWHPCLPVELWQLLEVNVEIGFPPEVVLKVMDGEFVE